jgi:hypothetical protein
MIPVHFPQATKILTAPAGKDDVGPLPIWTDGLQCGSCWALTWRERWQVLRTGRVFVFTQTGPTQPPIAVVAGNPLPR